MKTYHGTTVSSLLDSQRRDIFVTDSEAKAARYANAQATGRVSADYTGLAEGAAVLTVETESEPRWIRRANAQSLDECEAWLLDGYAITHAKIRWHPENTVYGRSGKMRRAQVIETLRSRGITVESE